MSGPQDNRPGSGPPPPPTPPPRLPITAEILAEAKAAGHLLPEPNWSAVSGIWAARLARYDSPISSDFAVRAGGAGHLITG